METEKKWWTSKTMWVGALIVLDALRELVLLVQKWIAGGGTTADLYSVVVPGILGILVMVFRKKATTTLVAFAAALLLTAAPGEANERLSGGLSVGPAVVQRDDGSRLAAIPRVWAGYSATDLLTAGAGVDLEISSARPAWLGWLGGRINLERSRDWRVAAGIDLTQDVGGDGTGSGWRALFTGTRILSRGRDGRPEWTAQYAPTLDFDNGKATHRLAVTWHAVRGGRFQ